MMTTTTAVLLAICAAAPLERPTMTFRTDWNAPEYYAGVVEKTADEQLRQQYRANIEKTAWSREHMDRLSGCLAMWKQTGDEKYRKAGLRMACAIVGDAVDADDATLQAMPDPARGTATRSKMARDACYGFGALYHLGGDKTHAHRAAVLLKRIAELMPNWPIWSPHYPVQDQKPKPRTWPGYVNTDRVNGLWGSWIYSALNSTRSLAYGYDLIYDSGELQRMGALEAVERELDWAVQFQLNYGREMGNMDGSTMRGLIEFGEILGRPELVHHCVKWIRDMYNTMYFADGWWHEGTPAYHQQISGNIKIVIDKRLQGYSDPPGYKSEDGARYDNLDMYALLKRPIERAINALNNSHHPDGNYFCIHDTSFPQVRWELRYPKEAKSILFGCMGHAVLGTGKGDNMVQASLHYSGGHGHQHWDTLNLNLFAKGKELISETRYRPMEGSKSTRQWHTMTAGHITVVIDEKNQQRTTTRKKQPSDAIPGIHDGKYRWSSHGNNMDEGHLRLHDTTFADVQVVEVDGNRAYPQTIKGIYRRLIALVKISETDTYVVDIFRVKGGKTHDYMLHGSLADPHTVELSVPVDQSMPGTLHKYIGNLRTGKTDKQWTATYALEGTEAMLRTWMLPQRGTTIIRGDAPAMRRIGSAPFIAVRQTDGESVYVAVHHPFGPRGPVVQDVELLGATLGRVRLRVKLPGHTDTITSTVRGFTHERSDKWRYELGGQHTLKGTITRTHRIEAGDDFDAYVTNAPLPTDGSLSGATIMLDLGVKQIVQGFTIDRVERQGDQTIIHTPDEPGITIEPGVVRQTYFPCFGIKGKARFRITAGRQTTP